MGIIDYVNWLAPFIFLIQLGEIKKARKREKCLWQDNVHSTDKKIIYVSGKSSILRFD